MEEESYPKRDIERTAIESEVLTGVCIFCHIIAVKNIPFLPLTTSKIAQGISNVNNKHLYLSASLKVLCHLQYQCFALHPHPTIAYNYNKESLSHT